MKITDVTHIHKLEDGIALSVSVWDFDVFEFIVRYIKNDKAYIL